MAKKIQKFFKNYNYAWKYKLTVCLPIIVVLVGLDWITKIVVQVTMEQGQKISFIDGFLDFNFIINPGSAYGVNANNLALAVSLATIVTTLLIVAFMFVNAKHWLVGLSIVIAGSFANLLARSWAPAVDGSQPDLIGIKGGVIDFLHWDFSFFGSNDYVFNLADLWVIFGAIAILLGVIIELIISAVKKKKENDKLEQATKRTFNPQKTPEAKFEKRDQSQMNEKELKQYQKEKKAFAKMKKMEEEQNEKKNH